MPARSGGGAGAGAGALEAVGVTDVGARSTVDDGFRTISRTSETTIAAAAIPAATIAAAARRVRYHGTGAGLKFQVLESKASKPAAAPSASPSACCAASFQR